MSFTPTQAVIELTARDEAAAQNLPGGPEGARGGPTSELPPTHLDGAQDDGSDAAPVSLRGPASASIPTAG